MAVNSTGLLSSPGIGSGLDVAGLVSKLMAVEQQPLTKLDAKEASYQAQISAYGSLNGTLSAFRTAAQGLVNGSSFKFVKASVADTSIASATASATASPASYSLEVSKLAQAHKLRTDGFSSTSAAVGTGSITIDFGTFDGVHFNVNGDKAATTIAIGAGQNTLSGIRDAINAASAGVTASIVNDGGANGYKLVLTSQSTGAASSVRVRVTDDDGNSTDASGLSQLAYNPEAGVGAGKNMTQLLVAQDAEFTLDNLPITSKTNTITDAIEGVSLTLSKTNVGSPTTVSVNKDTTTLKSAVEGFVKGYNDFNKSINDLQAYDPKTKKSGALQGDTVARTIQSQIRGLFNKNSVPTESGYSSLSALGVTFDRNGQLNIDQTKLGKALDESPKEVLKVFAQIGNTTDNQVEFVSATSKTKPGNYAVVLSQVGTQAKATSSVFNLNVVAGFNDELSITINNKTATVQLAAQLYASESALAAEIQTKVNGNSTFVKEGIGITVSGTTVPGFGGALTFTNKAYGSGSGLALSGKAFDNNLLSALVVTEGQDLAGTINGATATAKGQQLTAAIGNDADGITVKVTGGTTGDRGLIKYTEGLAVQLDKLIGNFTDGTTGLIASKTKGMNQSISDIGKQREVLNRRLEQIQQRYQAQFNALDTLVAKMNGTSNYLTQQLTALKKSTSE